MIGIYLMFNGKCNEALKLYEKAFNTKINEIRKYSDMPPNPNFPVSENEKDRILHSKLILDGTEIMCSDSSGECQRGSNMYVSITTKDEKLVRQAWDILKDSGEVYMELEPSFFALFHGSLRDQFGISWMFSVIK
ncbi:MAG: VOC family protein [Treponema sp.]|jgi:PhnB protein|nr:VOC family protein [Treponema sp.]